MTTTSNQLQLGRLERVTVRDFWADEARDFTPWLAQEENIALLGDIIRMELEIEEQERSVGPFRADILCKDTTDNHWVLIENQLERTDHTHLGQLVTYAAGLNAATIVWVADRFTEEHRAALDWLNEITAEEFRFFGLEVELWKIGDSPAAPKFNIVSKPNDWTSTVSRASRDLSIGELTDLKRLQLDYWTKLWELLESRQSPIRGTKPRPQHWNNFAIGRSKFGMHSTMNTQKHFVRVEVSCRGPHATAYFELLKQDQAAIESEIGATLDWQDLPTRKQTRIALIKPNTDPTDFSDWANQHAWIADQLVVFHRAFAPRIRDLDANEPDYLESGEA